MAQTAHGTHITRAPKTCALVFEGGGMRAAFSAAISKALIEAGIEFPFVAGVSAGSSMALNHVSGDYERSHRQFVEKANSAQFGGIHHFLLGHGFFNSDFLYEGSVAQNAVPFDWLTFCASRSEVAISSFGASTGTTYMWHKQDMPNALALMKLCRASSTLPLLMNPLTINGELCFDGGLGTYLGLSYGMALDAGYSHLVVVATQPRGYRKRPLSPAISRVMRARYGAYPHLLEALSTMHTRYNAAIERLETLERQGKAYVIRPQCMTISSTTLNKEALRDTYALASKQAAKEIEKVRAFLASF